LGSTPFSVGRTETDADGLLEGAGAGSVDLLHPVGNIIAPRATRLPTVRAAPRPELRAFGNGFTVCPPLMKCPASGHLEARS
jgi:hypothetical protein